MQSGFALAITPPIKCRLIGTERTGSLHPHHSGSVEFAPDYKCAKSTMLDQEQSLRLTLLRFPLIVGVVFIHAYSTT